MPAILAILLLFGAVGFIACGVTTWVLFQKRGELAIRTLENTYIPAVEQSHLTPEEKQAVIEQLESVAAEVKRGQYENWQAAGVMQRLVRLPVLQWGELHVIEAFLRQNPSPQSDDALRQLSRLRRAIELGYATTVDLDDVLKPVLSEGDGASRRSLKRPLNEAAVAEVIQRAELVADRGNVPDRQFDDVRIAAIVRRQIEKGVAEGTY